MRADSDARETLSVEFLNVLDVLDVRNDEIALLLRCDCSDRKRARRCVLARIIAINP